MCKIKFFLCFRQTFIYNNILKSIIKKEDINFLVNHAYKEGNPLYPVPCIWDKKDFKDLYLSLLK